MSLLSSRPSALKSKWWGLSEQLYVLLMCQSQPPEEKLGWMVIAGLFWELFSEKGLVN